MMMWRKLVSVVLALWCAPAWGQTVFFDDFDGNELLPHWSVPQPWQWEYNVSNSMLNVTGLFFPSFPPTNYAIFGAPFAPQADFQLDARMGWGVTENVNRFEVILLSEGGGSARIGFRDFVGRGPSIFAGTSAGVITIPAPPPGMYDFRITRVGGTYDFYFEGNHFASLTSSNPGMVNGLSVYMSSPYPGPSGPFHIDYVQVVPAPGVLLLLSGGIVFCSSPKRRRR